MASAAQVISAILGWTYFLSWSISLYPQAYQNWRTKSVIGFFCYSLFALSMYTDPAIRAEYRQRHEGKDNLVALNDVVFAVNAFVVTTIMLVQVIAYRVYVFRLQIDKRPREKLSKVGISSTLLVIVLMLLGLVLSGVKVILWLDYLYGLSYIKLVMTVIKYVPQAYLNYERKSTVGWNVYNVILDLIGSILSIAQLVLDSWINKNWGGIAGFAIKLGLGIVSLFFDIVFLLQHYVFYPQKTPTMRVKLDEKGK